MQGWRWMRDTQDEEGWMTRGCRRMSEARMKKDDDARMKMAEWHPGWRRMNDTMMQKGWRRMMMQGWRWMSDTQDAEWMNGTSMQKIEWHNDAKEWMTQGCRRKYGARTLRLTKGEARLRWTKCGKHLCIGNRRKERQVPQLVSKRLCFSDGTAAIADHLSMWQYEGTLGVGVITLDCKESAACVWLLWRWNILEMDGEVMLCPELLEVEFSWVCSNSDCCSAYAWVV